ncbi:O-antigen ligase family protein [Thalassotalea sp. ND16A]|uniref:O-antigen ligase family protein n=1 Tax=Thalassotalea sp. ND16A TaxID=1535422 RepID=UPI00051D5408|nr:O-antigen ligase family protein [Thalassotalea sp. ND16A]KGJ94203.1 hypothetical protein ND16A_1409 [Thalassotalea sp. ND16A]
MNKTDNSTTTNAIFYLFLALLFWLPIPLGSNRPWAWSIMEVMSYALFIGIIYTHSGNQIKAQLKPYWPLIAGLGIFVIYQALQLVPIPPTLLKAVSVNTYLIKQSILASDSWWPIALDPTQASIATLKALSYFLMMLTTLILVNNFKRLKLLLITLIVAGTWQAFYGSLQALSGNEHSFFMQLANSTAANGSFVYKNHFANFLMLTLAIGTGYLVSTLDSNRASKTSNKDNLIKLLTSLVSGKAALRIALAIMVIAIVLSRSRMGNTAFFVALTLTGLVAFGLMKQKNKSLSILLISIFIIDAFILGAYFGIDKVKQRIAQTSMQTEQRDEVNEYSFELVKLFPETGTGGGSYYSTFPLVQGSDVTAYFDHAHNDYLQFAIEYGLPATIWLAMVVLISLSHAIMAMKERRSRLLQGLGFACCMAITGMLIHISVDFQLQAPANAAYFHLILALAWLSRYGLRSSRLQNGSVN